MTKPTRIWAIAIAILLGATTLGAAEQLVNGGFESPALPPGATFILATGGDIPGWTIPAGWSIDLIRDYWPPDEGYQSIDLDGDSGIGATILQRFETVPGRMYMLAFAYANNKDTDTATGRVQVLGNAALVDTTLTHSGSTFEEMNYVPFVRRFTADAAETTLQFTHVWSPDFGRGLAIDAVSVTPADVGACCFDSGACLEGSAEDCEAAGGAYQGNGVTCAPDPCASVPTVGATWGRIRSMYR